MYYSLALLTYFNDQIKLLLEFGVVFNFQTQSNIIDFYL